jgi:hypothetical protein
MSLDQRAQQNGNDNHINPSYVPPLALNSPLLLFHSPLMPHSSSYSDRQTGIYQRIPETVGRDSQSLTVLDPSSLFPNRISPWKGGNTTTRFYLKDTHARDSEATVILVGEILGTDHGTAMGALGGTKYHDGVVCLFLDSLF